MDDQGSQAVQQPAAQRRVQQQLSVSQRYQVAKRIAKDLYVREVEKSATIASQAREVALLRQLLHDREQEIGNLRSATEPALDEPAQFIRAGPEADVHQLVEDAAGGSSSTGEADPVATARAARNLRKSVSTMQRALVMEQRKLDQVVAKRSLAIARHTRKTMERAQQAQVSAGSSTHQVPHEAPMAPDAAAALRPLSVGRFTRRSVSLMDASRSRSRGRAKHAQHAHQGDAPAAQGSLPMQQSAEKAGSLAGARGPAAQQIVGHNNRGASTHHAVGQASSPFAAVPQSAPFVPPPAAVQAGPRQHSATERRASQGSQPPGPPSQHRDHSVSSREPSSSGVPSRQARLTATASSVYTTTTSVHEQRRSSGGGHSGAHLAGGSKLRLGSKLRALLGFKPSDGSKAAKQQHSSGETVQALNGQGLPGRPPSSSTLSTQASTLPRQPSSTLGPSGPSGGRPAAGMLHSQHSGSTTASQPVQPEVGPLSRNLQRLRAERSERADAASAWPPSDCGLQAWPTAWACCSAGNGQRRPSTALSVLGIGAHAPNPAGQHQQPATAVFSTRPTPQAQRWQQLHKQLFKEEMRGGSVPQQQVVLNAPEASRAPSSKLLSLGGGKPPIAPTMVATGVSGMQVSSAGSAAPGINLIAIAAGQKQQPMASVAQSVSGSHRRTGSSNSIPASPAGPGGMSHDAVGLRIHSARGSRYQQPSPDAAAAPHTRVFDSQMLISVARAVVGQVPSSNHVHSPEMQALGAGSSRENSMAPSSCAGSYVSDNPRLDAILGQLRSFSHRNSPLPTPKQAMACEGGTTSFILPAWTPGQTSSPHQAPLHGAASAVVQHQQPTAAAASDEHPHAAEAPLVDTSPGQTVNTSPGQTVNTSLQQRRLTQHGRRRMDAVVLVSSAGSLEGIDTPVEGLNAGLLHQFVQTRLLDEQMLAAKSPAQPDAAVGPTESAGNVVDASKVQALDSLVNYDRTLNLSILQTGAAATWAVQLAAANKTALAAALTQHHNSESLVLYEATMDPSAAGAVSSALALLAQQQQQQQQHAETKGLLPAVSSAAVVESEAASAHADSHTSLYTAMDASHGCATGHHTVHARTIAFAEVSTTHFHTPVDKCGTDAHGGHYPAADSGLSDCASNCVAADMSEPASPPASHAAERPVQQANACVTSTSSCGSACFHSPQLNSQQGDWSSSKPAAGNRAKTEQEESAPLREQQALPQPGMGSPKHLAALAAADSRTSSSTLEGQASASTVSEADANAPGVHAHSLRNVHVLAAAASPAQSGISSHACDVDEDDFGGDADAAAAPEVVEEAGLGSPAAPCSPCRTNGSRDSYYRDAAALHQASAGSFCTPRNMGDLAASRSMLSVAAVSAAAVTNETSDTPTTGGTDMTKQELRQQMASGGYKLMFARSLRDIYTPDSAHSCHPALQSQAPGSQGSSPVAPINPQGLFPTSSCPPGALHPYFGTAAGGQQHSTGRSRHTDVPSPRSPGAPGNQLGSSRFSPRPVPAVPGCGWSSPASAADRLHTTSQPSPTCRGENGKSSAGHTAFSYGPQCSQSSSVLQQATHSPGQSAAVDSFTAATASNAIMTAGDTAGSAVTSMSPAEHSSSQAVHAVKSGFMSSQASRAMRSMSLPADRSMNSSNHASPRALNVPGVSPVFSSPTRGAAQDSWQDASHYPSQGNAPHCAYKTFSRSYSHSIAQQTAPVQVQTQSSSAGGGLFRAALHPSDAELLLPVGIPGLGMPTVPARAAAKQHAMISSLDAQRQYGMLQLAVQSRDSASYNSQRQCLQQEATHFVVNDPTLHSHTPSEQQQWQQQAPVMESDGCSSSDTGNENTSVNAVVRGMAVNVRHDNISADMHDPATATATVDMQATAAAALDTKATGEADEMAGVEQRLAADIDSGVATATGERSQSADGALQASDVSQAAGAHAVQLQVLAMEEQEQDESDDSKEACSEELSPSNSTVNTAPRDHEAPLQDMAANSPAAKHLPPALQLTIDGRNAGSEDDEEGKATLQHVEQQDAHCTTPQDNETQPTCQAGDEPCTRDSVASELQSDSPAAVPSTPSMGAACHPAQPNVVADPARVLIGNALQQGNLSTGAEFPTNQLMCDTSTAQYSIQIQLPSPVCSPQQHSSGSQADTDDGLGGDELLHQSELASTAATSRADTATGGAIAAGSKGVPAEKAAHSASGDCHGHVSDDGDSADEETSDTAANGAGCTAAHNSPAKQHLGMFNMVLPSTFDSEDSSENNDGSCSDGAPIIKGSHHVFGKLGPEIVLPSGAPSSGGGAALQLLPPVTPQVQAAAIGIGSHGGCASAPEAEASVSSECATTTPCSPTAIGQTEPEVELMSEQAGTEQFGAQQQAVAAHQHVSQQSPSNLARSHVSIANLLPAYNALPALLAPAASDTAMTCAFTNTTSEDRLPGSLHQADSQQFASSGSERGGQVQLEAAAPAMVSATQGCRSLQSPIASDNSSLPITSCQLAQEPLAGTDAGRGVAEHTSSSMACASDMIAQSVNAAQYAAVLRCHSAAGPITVSTSPTSMPAVVARPASISGGWFGSMISSFVNTIATPLQQALADLPSSPTAQPTAGLPEAKPQTLRHNSTAHLQEPKSPESSLRASGTGAVAITTSTAGTGAADQVALQHGRQHQGHLELQEELQCKQDIAAVALLQGRSSLFESPLGSSQNLLRRVTAAAADIISHSAMSHTIIATAMNGVPSTVLGRTHSTTYSPGSARHTFSPAGHSLSGSPGTASKPRFDGVAVLLSSRQASTVVDKAGGSSAAGSVFSSPGKPHSMELAGSGIGQGSPHTSGTWHAGSGWLEHVQDAAISALQGSACSIVSCQHSNVGAMPAGMPATCGNQRVNLQDSDAVLDARDFVQPPVDGSCPVLLALPDTLSSGHSSSNDDEVGLRDGDMHSLPADCCGDPAHAIADRGMPAHIQQQHVQATALQQGCELASDFAHSTGLSGQQESAGSDHSMGNAACRPPHVGHAVLLPDTLSGESSSAASDTLHDQGTSNAAEGGDEHAVDGKSGFCIQGHLRQSLCDSTGSAEEPVNAVMRQSPHSSAEGCVTGTQGEAMHAAAASNPNASYRGLARQGRPARVRARRSRPATQPADPADCGASNSGKPGGMAGLHPQQPACHVHSRASSLAGSDSEKADSTGSVVGPAQCVVDAGDSSAPTNSQRPSSTGSTPRQHARQINAAQVSTPCSKQRGKIDGDSINHSQCASSNEDMDMHTPGCMILHVPTPQVAVLAAGHAGELRASYAGTAHGASTGPGGSRCKSGGRRTRTHSSGNCWSDDGCSYSKGVASRAAGAAPLPVPVSLQEVECAEGAPEWSDYGNHAGTSSSDGTSFTVEGDFHATAVHQARHWDNATSKAVPATCTADSTQHRPANNGSRMCSSSQSVMPVSGSGAKQASSKHGPRQRPSANNRQQGKANDHTWADDDEVTSPHRSGTASCQGTVAPSSEANDGGSEGELDPSVLSQLETRYMAAVVLQDMALTTPRASSKHTPAPNLEFPPGLLADLKLQVSESPNTTHRTRGRTHRSNGSGRAATASEPDAVGKLHDPYSTGSLPTADAMVKARHAEAAGSRPGMGMGGEGLHYSTATCASGTARPAMQQHAPYAADSIGVTTANTDAAGMHPFQAVAGEGGLMVFSTHGHDAHDSDMHQTTVAGDTSAQHGGLAACFTRRLLRAGPFCSLSTKTSDASSSQGLGFQSTTQSASRGHARGARKAGRHSNSQVSAARSKNTTLPQATCSVSTAAFLPAADFQPAPCLPIPTISNTSSQVTPQLPFAPAASPHKQLYQQQQSCAQAESVTSLPSSAGGRSNGIAAAFGGIQGVTRTTAPLDPNVRAATLYSSLGYGGGSAGNSKASAQLTGVDAASHAVHGGSAGGDSRSAALPQPEQLGPLSRQRAQVNIPVIAPIINIPMPARKPVKTRLGTGLADVSHMSHTALSHAAPHAQQHQHGSSTSGSTFVIAACRQQPGTGEPPAGQAAVTPSQTAGASFFTWAPPPVTQTGDNIGLVSGSVFCATGMAAADQQPNEYTSHTEWEAQASSVDAWESAESEAHTDHGCYHAGFGTGGGATSSTCPSTAGWVTPPTRPASQAGWATPPAMPDGSRAASPSPAR